MREIRYFAFEGIVGAGKSRQFSLFVHELKKVWNGEILATKEPGGCEIADEIRRVVQATRFGEEMEPISEQLLYAASRAQTLRTLVRPTLNRQGIVVSDRSVFSSIAYQGFGRGLGYETVKQINQAAVEDLWPHAVFFINTDIEVALARTSDLAGDKFEGMQKDFYIRCLEGYKYIAKNYDNIFEIDGNGTVSEVHQQIWSIASGLLGI
jgi:dTMP kinase